MDRKRSALASGPQFAGPRIMSFNPQNIPGGVCDTHPAPGNRSREGQAGLGRPLHLLAGGWAPLPGPSAQLAPRHLLPVPPRSCVTRGGQTQLEVCPERVIMSNGLTQIQRPRSPEVCRPQAKPRERTVSVPVQPKLRQEGTSGRTEDRQADRANAPLLLCLFILWSRRRVGRGPPH